MQNFTPIIIIIITVAEISVTRQIETKIERITADLISMIIIIIISLCFFFYYSWALPDTNKWMDIRQNA